MFNKIFSTALSVLTLSVISFGTTAHASPVTFDIGGTIDTPIHITRNGSTLLGSAYTLTFQADNQAIDTVVAGCPCDWQNDGGFAVDKIFLDVGFGKEELDLTNILNPELRVYSNGSIAQISFSSGLFSIGTGLQSNIVSAIGDANDLSTVASISGNVVFGNWWLARGGNASTLVGVLNSTNSYTFLNAPGNNQTYDLDPVSYRFSSGAAAIPEPAPIALLSLGLIGFNIARKRRR